MVDNKKITFFVKTFLPMVIAFTILTFALKSVILIYFVLSSFLNIHVTKIKKKKRMNNI